MKAPQNPWLPILLLCTACASADDRKPYASVECWGTMREVLAEGHSQGRAWLNTLPDEDTWGVGVLAGLEGEVTIVDGEVVVATVDGGELVHRRVGSRDRATLLVLATVEEWTQRELLELRSLGDLEAHLGSVLRDSSIARDGAPIPIRIEGAFERIDLHVIDGSCPQVDPAGRAPWRWSGEAGTGTVVGIFVEGQAGRLTHHGQSVHLHGVVTGADGVRRSGHVDGLALGPGAQLFLPKATEPD